jgi:hypothetical protein
MVRGILTVFHWFCLLILFTFGLAGFCYAGSLTNNDLVINSLTVGDYGAVSFYDNVVPIRVQMINADESSTMKDLRVKVEISELNIVYYTHLFDVKHSQRDTRWVFLELPDDIEKGDYLVKVSIYNDNVKRIRYRYISIV